MSLSPLQERLALLVKASGDPDKKQNLLTKNSDVPVLTSGRPFSFKVDRLDLLRTLYLFCAVTVSTGATPGTPGARVRMPSEWGTLQVYINGALEFQVNADLAFCLAQLFRRQMPLPIDSITNAELAAGSTTPSGAISIPIDFDLPLTFPKIFGAVPAGNANVTNISVQGTAPAVANLMDSPGATQAISALALTPYIERALDPHVGIKNHPGFGAAWRRAQSVTVPSTGFVTMRFDAGRAYMGIALRCTGGATNAASDAILTAGQLIQVKANGVPVWEGEASKLALDTAAMLPASFPRTGFYYIDLLQGAPYDVQASIRAGNADLEFVFHGTTTTNAAVDACPIVLADILDTAQGRGLNPAMYGA